MNTQKTTFTRSEAIETLINNDFDAFNQGVLSLDTMLREGCEGYDNMKNKELQTLLTEYFDDGINYIIIE